ncbi:MAG: hypothetical protein CMJ51_03300 [Planctomycetaceae bacterium]|nr:hypothetical protein [Planctomycetaceae bacterium]
MKRHGLTLVELLVALAVTTIVAAGVASLLSGVTAGLAAGSDTRTAMLANAASHRRLTERLETADCVLDIDAHRTLLWNGDRRPGGAVESSEAAWITYDPDRGEIVREVVEFPEDWGAFELAMSDHRLEPRSDDLSILAGLRGRGYVQRVVLVDGLSDATFTAAPDGSTLRLDLAFDLQTGPSPATTVVRLVGTTPQEWDR